MLLTVQAFHQGQWHDAAELIIEQPERGRRGPARLGYLTDYALEWLDRDVCSSDLMSTPVAFVCLLS